MQSVFNYRKIWRFPKQECYTCPYSTAKYIRHYHNTLRVRFLMIVPVNFEVSKIPDKPLELLLLKTIFPIIPQESQFLGFCKLTYIQYRFM
jgi:hypothetical protein